MVLAHLALFDAGEQADGANGVFVHRVVVIHVELHLRVHPAEIRHETTENASLVQPAQGGFGIVAAGQQFHEQRIGGRIAAQGGVDQLRVAGNLPHGFGVDFQPLAVGQHEDFQQAHRAFGKPVVARRGNAARGDAIAVQILGTGAQPGDGALPRLLGVLLLQLGQEHAGEAANLFGLQEEILHEALDRALAGPVGEVHPRGHLPLQIEGEAVLGAAGDGVQMAAHRPEEGFGPAEGAIFLARQQAHIHQFGGIAHLVEIFADPVERVQIAQAALALLDVGLHHIAGIAELAVAFAAFRQLFGDIVPLGSGDHLGPEAAGGLFE